MSSSWDDPRQATNNQVHKYLPSGQRMTTVEENTAFQQACKKWGEAMLPHMFPGALVFVFAGTRMWEWLATGMQMAGYEHWDTLMWVYGSGFPKAQDVGRMIDRANGNEREVTGRNPNSRESCSTDNTLYRSGTAGKTALVSRGNSGWDGYKTPALKPSWEPILCFRAPRGNLTYAELALTYGTGCLNVDGGRIPVNDGTKLTTHSKSSVAAAGKGIYSPYGGVETHQSSGQELGRYPANLVLGEEAADMLGNIARFFYCPKASRKEREAGCESLDKMPFETNEPYGKGAAARKENNAEGIRNNHPTVKPIALAEHLATLLLPPASVSPRRLLVPFLGSGSEMIGAMKAGWDEIVGVEQDAHYCQIAEARVAHHRQGLGSCTLAASASGCEKLAGISAAGDCLTCE